MSNVKGIISGVKDNGPTKGKYGTQYRIGFVVDGERYSGFFGKSAEGLGLEDGKLVTFTYTEKGEYKNIDPKSLKVSSVAEAPASSPSAPRAAGGQKIAGVTVGMALNNACNLIAHGIVVAPEGMVLTTIEKVAKGILALSAKLEQGSPAPAPAVATAKPVSAPVEAPEDEEEEEASEPAPPPKKVAKAPVAAPTAKPVAKGKAKPVVEDEPSYDDDVPF